MSYCFGLVWLLSQLRQPESFKTKGQWESHIPFNLLSMLQLLQLVQLVQLRLVQPVQLVQQRPLQEPLVPSGRPVCLRGQRQRAWRQ